MRKVRNGKGDLLELVRHSLSSILKNQSLQDFLNICLSLLGTPIDVLFLTMLGSKRARGAGRKTERRGGGSQSKSVLKNRI